MTPEIAKAMLDYAVTDARQEATVTRKVLAALPEGKDDYSPDPKSMKALDLAWHIASADVWWMGCVVDGKFEWVGGDRPAELKTGADIAAWYETNLGAKLDQVSALSGEKAAAVLDFFGAFQAPACVMTSACLKHSIHHRGQLSAYLRPMGGKVPAIYGGSADEPMQH